MVNGPGSSPGVMITVGPPLFSNLLDSLEEPAIILDDSHRVAHANDAASRLLGHPPQELIGGTILDVARPRQAKEIWQLEKSALETGMPCKYVGPLDYPGDRILDSKTFIPFASPDSGRRYLLVIIRVRPARSAGVDRHTAESAELSRQLDDARTALRVLIEQRETDCAQANDSLSEKLRSMLIPYIDQLKHTRLEREQREIIELVEANLNKFLDPHAARLASAAYGLSPTEIQVAQYVRAGKTNKEIAGLMRLSKSTILTHRHHIRVKLGLKNMKKNLRTFLLSM